MTTIEFREGDTVDVVIRCRVEAVGFGSLRVKPEIGQTVNRTTFYANREKVTLVTRPKRKLKVGDTFTNAAEEYEELPVGSIVSRVSKDYAYEWVRIGDNWIATKGGVDPYAWRNFLTSTYKVERVGK